MTSRSLTTAYQVLLHPLCTTRKEKFPMAKLCQNAPAIYTSVCIGREHVGNDIAILPDATYITASFQVPGKQGKGQNPPRRSQ
jgi:hypothetical protein